MIRFADKRGSWFWGLCLLLLPAGATAQVVQDQAGERYEIAQDLYEEGRLNQVIDTLLPFFDQRSARRSDILSLSAATYKFLDQDIKARQQLLRLFNMDPFYRLDQSIPELRYLEEDLVIYPKFALKAKAGVYIFSRPWMVNKSSDGRSNVVSEKFALDARDQIGSLAEVSAGRSLWPEGPYLYAGLGLSRYSFRYTGVYENVENPEGNMDQATFSFREKHWWLHLPVYLKQHFLIPGKDFREQIFIPYGFAGVSLDLMRRPSAEWTDISLQYEQIEESSPTNFNDIAIADLRNAFNFSLMAGGGIQARSGYHLGFIEVGFSQMFRNLRSSDNMARALSAQIEEDFHYQGTDFLLSNLQVTIGYSRFFYRASEK
jgi:hypothetical protein